MPEHLSIDGRPVVPGRPTYGTGVVFEVTPLFVAVASIRGQLALETDKQMGDADMDPYHDVTARLALLNGERVRLTHHGNHALRETGIVSMKDYGMKAYGHCVDVLIDGHGGQTYADVTRIERMGDNGRYAAVWTA